MWHARLWHSYMFLIYAIPWKYISRSYQENWKKQCVSNLAPIVPNTFQTHARFSLAHATRGDKGRSRRQGKTCQPILTIHYPNPRFVASIQGRGAIRWKQPFSILDPADIFRSTRQYHCFVYFNLLPYFQTGLYKVELRHYVDEWVVWRLGACLYIRLLFGTSLLDKSHVTVRLGGSDCQVIIQGQRLRAHAANAGIRSNFPHVGSGVSISNHVSC